MALRGTGPVAAPGGVDPVATLDRVPEHPADPVPDQGVATVGVSIAIPEPFGSELESWRSSFGDPLASLVPAHITLLPPTPLSVEALDGAHRHLCEVAASHTCFDVMLRGAATFQPVSPVVFVPVVRGIGDCERLQRKVRSGPLGRSLSFPYHPHVTVAHDLEAPKLEQAFESLFDYAALFRACQFTLYQRDDAGVWSAWHSYDLAPAA
ncbi:2'-5' RNA ligase family protein [Lipingzhangella sp. LS1_29]|uniref:2'-5' RNA ligase family protein n=1 Tax=Lipingzhangella rawalii TaxID=2055835 RepID=A0ABU2H4P2_9ACTN|nr:2'-5' RNA ligase family protein [Lipingzhangella rawalii]MDS1269829.1 2'-5' RNA ligase family protein [Lipingzhangella rawalii]